MAPGEPRLRQRREWHRRRGIWQIEAFISCAFADAAHDCTHRQIGTNYAPSHPGDDTSGCPHASQDTGKRSAAIRVIPGAVDAGDEAAPPAEPPRSAVVAARKNGCESTFSRPSRNLITTTRVVHSGTSWHLLTARTPMPRPGRHHRRGARCRPDWHRCLWAHSGSPREFSGGGSRRGLSYAPPRWATACTPRPQSS